MSAALFTLALVIAVASAMLRHGLATLPVTLPLMLTATALLRASTPHAARFRLVTRVIYAVVGGAALLLGVIASVWPG